MSNQRTFRIILIGVLVVLLTGGGFLLYQYLQKEQWISQQVYTQSMDEARKHAYLGLLSAKTLLTPKNKAADSTLYSAVFYPECHTVLCTITLPEQFEQSAFYLQTEDGHLYPGWFTPQFVKYGIAKVAFENLETDRLVRLYVADQSKIGSNGFSPEDGSIPKLTFELNPPDRSESSSEAASVS